MIKAIETEYQGCRFRSRLEARWAVFFDSLGVEWQYELEGFKLEDGTWYLPDFYLPRQQRWLEIKPNTGSLDDWPDHPLLEKSILPGFTVLLGEPWLDPSAVREVQRLGQTLYQVSDSRGFHYNGFIAADCYYRWCVCPDCGFVDLQFEGRSDRLSCKTCQTCEEIRQRYPEGFAECTYHGIPRARKCRQYGLNDDKGYNDGHPRLIAAYRAARSARFEHGEKP
jgi:hypothetical protein